MIIKIFEEFVENLIYNWVKLPNRSIIDDPLNIERMSQLLTHGLKFRPNDGGGRRDRMNAHKYPFCISTTRNKRWKYGNNEIRVVMDIKKVGELYRVDPLAFASERGEYEERILSKKDGYLSPKYFTCIEVSSKYFEIFRSLDNPYNVDIKLNDDMIVPRNMVGKVTGNIKN
jgi:hypothetical protein